MKDDCSTKNCDKAYTQGWQEGRDRLFSAFVWATTLTQGLSPKEIDELAEFCSLLTYCIGYISGRERYYFDL